MKGVSECGTFFLSTQLQRTVYHFEHRYISNEWKRDELNILFKLMENAYDKFYIFLDRGSIDLGSPRYIEYIQTRRLSF